MGLTKIPKALENSFSKDALIYMNDNEFCYNTETDKDLIRDLKNHEFQVYNGTYRYNDNGTTTIFLVGKGITCGKKIFKVENFYPYCYMYYNDGKYVTYQGRRVDKVVFQTLPKAVGKVRQMFERMDYDNTPCEADIPFVRRFLIDTADFFQAKDAIPASVAIMDVETNFPINNNIISFALNGSDGFLYFNSIHEDSKFGVVLDCYDKLNRYDIVTNWNVDFDIGALEAQLQKITVMFTPIDDGHLLDKEEYIRTVALDYGLAGVPTTTQMVEALIEYGYIVEDKDGILHRGKEFNPDLYLTMTPMDLLAITKKMYAREINGRWSLDNVGIQLCGCGKVEYEEKYVKDIAPDKLLEYNVMDVIVPEIIDAYLGGIECHTILAWSINCTLSDSLITAIVNDIALIKAYHRDGVVLLSRPPRERTKVEDESIKYKAAEPDARHGVYANIVASDLHAAYPSAVMAINASCETKDPLGCYKAPNGIRFNDGESTFIEELKHLLNERREVKKNLKLHEKNSPEWRKYKFIDFALKTQVAAFSHGIFGWANSRMKDFEVADSITATVRGILDTIKAYVDEIGCPWVYCHTDSVYFNGPPNDYDIQNIIDNLNVQIKNYCNQHNYFIVPELEYKGFYPKAYIHSAARNVLVDSDGNWDTTGMNFMRSEVPAPLADIERELILMKLNEKTPEEILKRLKEFVLSLPQMDTRDLGVIKPLTKPISKYGRKGKDGGIVGIPYHITALLKAEKDYGFTVKVGEKFMVIPIMLDEFTGVKVIRRKRGYMAYPIDEGLPGMYEVDYNQYLKSNLWGKINKLFNIKPKQLENLIVDEKVKTVLNMD